MMAAVLEISGLTMDFGGLRALESLDFTVHSREIVALIGPNGAGKTTFFNCITGIYAPTGGDIHLVSPQRGRERINGLKPNRITEKGMARTFQNIRLFSNMTVLENVMIGRHCRSRVGILGAVFRNSATRAEEQEVVDSSFAILEKMGLAHFANDYARNLPYGAQRLLEIGRALATDPFLLLLDEPAAGMNPQETRELDERIVRIRDEEGVAILLIEHDMRLVMSLAERIVVMDSGRKLADGVPVEIRNNPEVIRAYLGDMDA